MQLKKREIAKKAAELLMAQRFVPRSPGAFVNGKPLLCAGAAFVCEASLMANQSSDRNLLASSMVSNGREYIFEIAKYLDLDLKELEQTFLTNDSCPDQLRQKVLVERFRSPSLN
jgi:hypothetical protein